MNTKELEKNIKKIIATGSGYGSEYKPVLKRTKVILNNINKGRRTAENFFELGELFLNLEDTSLARDAFKAGYQLNPNHVNCGCYYGLLLEQADQTSEALTVYIDLNKIAPENIVLAERMLSIFYDKKDYRQVFIICQYFLASKLSYAVTYEYIAKIHFDYGLKDEAIRYLENALVIEPENDTYIQKLIVYYFHNGNFTKVVDLKSYIDNTETLPINIPLIYANALANIGNIAESRKYFTKILLDSEGSDKYNVLSEIALFHQHVEQNTKKAIFIFGYILKRDPFNIMAMSNMAQYKSNDYCLNAYKEAYQQQPNNAVVALNYAYSLLDDGQLKEGFKLYENRLVVHARFLTHRVSSPDNLQDKRLFIWKEQGLGDEIRWAWFYNHLSKSCLKATIQVDERLLSLMNRSFPDLLFTGKTVKELINDEDLSVYDNEIMMASLGRYYIDEIVDAQNNFERGGFEKPFFITDDEKVSHWKQKLLRLTNKKTVGICWRSGLQEKLRYLHYMSAEQIIEVFTDVDCCLVNVQYDYTKDELELLSSALGERFIHFPEIDLKNDIDDLAALLKALDLVFTAATAVSALAGAIGSDTLTFMHMGADDSLSFFGKPYDVFYSRNNYLGEKNKKHSELLECYRENIKKKLIS